MIRPLNKRSAVVLVAIVGLCVKGTVAEGERGTEQVPRLGCGAQQRWAQDRGCDPVLHGHAERHYDECALRLGDERTGL